MGAHILVVDDDPGIRFALSLKLKQSGYTAAKHLHANAATSSLPLVFLTAQNLEVPADVRPLIGRHRFLTKPFSPRDVVAAVAELLRGQ